MLSPVSFRICCIAAMAPALTEAASQAESFSLPHSPASSTICNSNPTSPPTNERTVANGSSKDLTRRFRDKHRILWDSVNFAALANVKLKQLREGFHDADAVLKAMNAKDNMGLTNGNDSLHSPPATPTVVSSPSQPYKETVVQSPVTFPPDRPQTPCTETYEELVERARARKSVLERRSERLHRRIRRLQLRQAIQHCNTQLGGFLEHQQKSLAIPCLMPQAQRLLHRKLRDGADIKAELLLQNEDVKNLSTAALVSLVRKLEESSQGAPSTPARLPELEREECDRVSGTLRTTLSHQERVVDSDATASSSGGESCDEADVRDTVDTFGTPTPTTDSAPRSKPSIRQSAAWTWVLERAAVASRWTWLQAQVADLEFRIRQQNDICRQLRHAKGRLRLEGEPQLPNDVLATTNKRPFGPGSQENMTTTKVTTPTANGMVPGAQDVPGCSRTRPLVNFRKRKVVSSTVASAVASVSPLGRKTARLGGASSTTVQCDCRSVSSCQASPCPLCAGRYSVLRQLDPDAMPQRERAALLDAGFHPVLSFRNDMPLNLHFEMLLRTGELQKLALKASASLRKKSRLAQVSGLAIDQARKKSRKLAHNAAQSLLSSAKMRRHHSEKKRAYRRHVDREVLDDDSSDSRFRRSDTYSLVSMKHRERQRSLSTASSGSSKAASPVPSPAPCSGEGTIGQRSILQDVLRRRRGENAFDINNIVIPYSLASATRVERLPYKEILTPKWRELTEEELNGTLQVDPLESKEEVEDLSDEAFTVRHNVCEEEERHRFAGLLSKSNAGSQLPHPNSQLSHPPRGGRSRLRTQDSCSEVVDIMESPVMSPAEEDWYEVAPYELRTFPLCDEDVSSMLESSPHLRPPTPPSERPSTPPPGSPSPASPTSSYPPPDSLSQSLASPGSPPPVTLAASASLQLTSQLPSSPASSLSSLPPGEDPNDPEWTVVNSEKKQNLVLKLAKR
uniref:Putative kat8 regulatory nsl complex subunit 1 n=1 Tax=Ornithodoros turicata TaxID=34597 RepID=A0A2R5LLB4_9ACAR